MTTLARCSVYTIVLVLMGINLSTNICAIDDKANRLLEALALEGAPSREEQKKLTRSRTWSFGLSQAERSHEDVQDVVEEEAVEEKREDDTTTLKELPKAGGGDRAKEFTFAQAFCRFQSLHTLRVPQRCRSAAMLGRPYLRAQ